MIVPALIYAAVNLGGKGDLRGWSVPVATDIAFALAVLAMAGKRLPGSLRVFLLTLAIVDDLGAVAIIGIFYNSHFNGVWCAAMVAGLAVMAAAVFVVRSSAWLRAVYWLLFVVVWAFAVKAGLSPSLAAVLAGFCVALEMPGGGSSPLQNLAIGLHPYVAYLILPLFAFTASGFSLKGFSIAGHDAFWGDPRFLGVLLGLFIGKQLGVFAAAWGAIRFGFAALPHRANWFQLYAVCLLCGIGFTMSLFLAALAFPGTGETAQNAVKFGVIAGSLLSACAGAAILLWARRARPINE
jgi:NhaA family Na+:H+ antiporter